MYDRLPLSSIVCIDVFDTVITRNLHRPADLFLRMKQHLAGHASLSSSIIRDFHAARIFAEADARQRISGREEVTFDEIWKVFSENTKGGIEQVSSLKSEEIKAELDSIAPIASTCALIKRLRAAGCQIVFVSDMYLSTELIRSMLVKAGAFELGDRLYVSSEIGQKKSTGNLFRYISNELGVDTKEIMHFGDYLWSDVIVPRWKHGIHSLPVRIARANIYEKLWGEPCRCIYCSSVAGASRAARLAKDTLGRSSLTKTLYEIGCNILGPILTGFILWMFQQAAQNGIKRLYFLSRDGEIILEVARELVKKLGIDIELRYLYVSRTAVFPALPGTGVTAQTIKWLTEETIILTPRIIADRLKLDSDSLYEQLIEAGASLKGIDSPLDEKSVDSICDVLVADSRLQTLLALRGSEIKKSLAGYLEQERLFDGTPSAFVDLGWHGGIQDVVHSCFAERFGNNGLTGYYFGVDLAGSSSNMKAGYLFNHDDRPDIDRFRHMFRIVLELMCTGSHGMVRNYALTDERTYEPVCSQPEHSANCERIQHIREGVAAYLEHLDGPSISTSDPLHVRHQMLAVLKKLFLYPSRSESIALGDFRFAADQSGHGINRVAAPFNFRGIISYFSQKTYAGRASFSSWFFASWLRSEITIRFFLWPLVVFLRFFYVGKDAFKYSMLRGVDVLNSLICASGSVDSGKNNDSH